MVKVKILKNFKSEAIENYGFHYMKTAVMYRNEHLSGDVLIIKEYRKYGNNSEIEREWNTFDSDELDLLIDGMGEFDWI